MSQLLFLHFCLFEGESLHCCLALLSLNLWLMLWHRLAVLHLAVLMLVHLVALVHSLAVPLMAFAVCLMHGKAIVDLLNVGNIGLGSHDVLHLLAVLLIDCLHLCEVSALMGSLLAKGSFL